MNGYATELAIVANILAILGGAFGLIKWITALHEDTRKRVEARHDENQRMLQQIQAGQSQMEVKVESMWEWFTTRLERRNERS